MAELSIVLVDADAMEALHKQWMELPGPTDVMAFPMDGSDGPLDRFDPSAPPPTDEGIAKRCSATSCCAPRWPPIRPPWPGTRVGAELQLLCTHGILHLLGYDHGDAESEKGMFDLQAKILADWTKRPAASRSAPRFPGRAARSGTSRAAACLTVTA